MRSIAMFGTGLVVGYIIRNRRQQALHNIACRLVDALFQPYDN
jgi:hypothetical protein